MHVIHNSEELPSADAQHKFLEWFLCVTCVL